MFNISKRSNMKNCSEQTALSNSINVHVLHLNDSINPTETTLKRKTNPKLKSNDNNSVTIEWRNRNGNIFGTNDAKNTKLSRIRNIESAGKTTEKLQPNSTETIGSADQILKTDSARMELKRNNKFTNISQVRMENESLKVVTRRSSKKTVEFKEFVKKCRLYLRQIMDFSFIDESEITWPPNKGRKALADFAWLERCLIVTSKCFLNWIGKHTVFSIKYCIDLLKLSQYLETFIMDTLYTEQELSSFYNDVDIIADGTVFQKFRFRMIKLLRIIQFFLEDSSGTRVIFSKMFEREIENEQESTITSNNTTDDDMTLSFVKELLKHSAVTYETLIERLERLPLIKQQVTVTIVPLARSSFIPYVIDSDALKSNFTNKKSISLLSDRCIMNDIIINNNNNNNNNNKNKNKITIHTDKVSNVSSNSLNFQIDENTNDVEKINRKNETISINNRNDSFCTVPFFRIDDELSNGTRIKRKFSEANPLKYASSERDLTNKSFDLLLKKNGPSDDRNCCRSVTDENDLNNRIVRKTLTRSFSTYTRSDIISNAGRINDDNNGSIAISKRNNSFSTNNKRKLSFCVTSSDDDNSDSSGSSSSSNSNNINCRRSVWRSINSQNLDNDNFSFNNNDIIDRTYRSDDSENLSTDRSNNENDHEFSNIDDCNDDRFLDNLLTISGDNSKNASKFTTTTSDNNICDVPKAPMNIIGESNIITNNHYDHHDHQGKYSSLDANISTVNNNIQNEHVKKSTKSTDTATTTIVATADKAPLHYYDVIDTEDNDNYDVLTGPSRSSVNVGRDDPRSSNPPLLEHRFDENNDGFLFLTALKKFNSQQSSLDHGNEQIEIYDPNVDEPHRIECPTNNDNLEINTTDNSQQSTITTTTNVYNKLIWSKTNENCRITRENYQLHANINTTNYDSSLEIDEDTTVRSLRLDRPRIFPVNWCENFDKWL